MICTVFFTLSLSAGPRRLAGHSPGATVWDSLDQYFSYQQTQVMCVCIPEKEQSLSLGMHDMNSFQLILITDNYLLLTSDPD